MLHLRKEHKEVTKTGCVWPKHKNTDMAQNTGSESTLASFFVLNPKRTACCFFPEGQIWKYFIASRGCSHPETIKIIIRPEKIGECAAFTFETDIIKKVPNEQLEDWKVSLHFNQRYWVISLTRVNRVSRIHHCTILKKKKVHSVTPENIFHCTMLYIQHVSSSSYFLSFSKQKKKYKSWKTDWGSQRRQAREKTRATTWKADLYLQISASLVHDPILTIDGHF